MVRAEQGAEMLETGRMRQGWDQGTKRLVGCKPAGSRSREQGAGKCRIWGQAKEEVLSLERQEGGHPPERGVSSKPTVPLI